VITSVFVVGEAYWGVEKCIRNFGILGNWGADGSKWIFKKLGVCVNWMNLVEDNVQSWVRHGNETLFAKAAIFLTNFPKTMHYLETGHTVLELTI